MHAGLRARDYQPQPGPYVHVPGLQLRQISAPCSRDRQPESMCRLGVRACLAALGTHHSTLLEPRVHASEVRMELKLIIPHLFHRRKTLHSDGGSNIPHPPGNQQSLVRFSPWMSPTIMTRFRCEISSSSTCRGAFGSRYPTSPGFFSVVIYGMKKSFCFSKQMVSLRTKISLAAEFSANGRHHAEHLRPSRSIPGAVHLDTENEHRCPFAPDSLGL